MYIRVLRKIRYYVATVFQIKKIQNLQVMSELPQLLRVSVLSPYFKAVTVSLKIPIIMAGTEIG
jgi:hypothetical protein